MRAGIFAKTFTGADPLSVLAKAKLAGYACVQYNLACSGLQSMPDEIPNEAIEAIAEARAKTGIEIAALSATYNMIHPDISVRETGMRRLETAVQAAARLGIPLVTLCTGTRDPDDQWRHHPDNLRDEAWRDLIVEMEKAARIAETHNLDLGIEPEHANVVCDAESAVRLMRDVPSPHLAIVLDPANLFEQTSKKKAQLIVAQAVERLQGRIAMAHAKDRAADGRFVTAGRGIVDFPDFIERLKQAGFDGPVVTHGLAEDEADDVGRFLGELLA
jgi:sugar phosphate isomerase/epimerase